jgi:osmoprotectant transport system substrate-binding protein
MSRKTFLRFAAPAAAVLAASALAGCGSTSSSGGSPLAGTASSGTVVVGSDNFAESILLADIYGQALVGKGIKVSYKLDIGSREVTYNLVKTGAITLKPEYNGALLAYLDSSAKQTSTSEVDNDTLTLSKQEATSLGLAKGATISDFITKLDGKSLIIGGSPEFQTRTEGILGLEQDYGLKASQITYKTLDAGGPLTEKALTSGQVNAGDLFTTDSTISQGGLLTLVDNKGIFGVQDVLPLVKKSALSQTGVDALNAVDAQLTSDVLLKLDTEVQVDKEDPLTVANAWLKSVGLSS